LVQYDQIIRKHLYEEIATKLEKMVLDETLKVGDKLPPEKNLAENFGVSRNILREALKTLKERGLIEVRTGDGVYIVKPGTDVLKDMVNRLIILGGVSIRDLFEFRLAIEVKSCGLAAEKADEGELKHLEEIINKMKNDVEDPERWAKEELEFHMSIAKASKNTLFYSFISPISNLLFELFLKGRQNPQAKIEGIEGHIAIVKNLKKRNKALAEEAMRKHLEHSMELIPED
jgi:GntR family transcriptional regulator, transcriptional repressor for pyruvate dehydrogenase complex